MAVPLNRRELGLTLTRLANASDIELASWGQQEPALNPARRIGVTGAPGAGKSTLLGRLALHRLTKGRVGVLAVDPSSPKTGGAILGDRIRMDDLERSSELYIRSFGSRASSDGLTDNLCEMLDAMDNFAFHEVFLETVGVGQAEYAVRQYVDTLVLVMHPDSGDTVQAMKAGISEMADIFVVTKADLSGAQKAVNHVKHIASLVPRANNSWEPPVLLMSETQPQLIEAISGAIDQHQQWSEQQGFKEQQLLLRNRYRLQRLLERAIAQVLVRQEARFFTKSVGTQLELVLKILGKSTRR